MKTIRSFACLMAFILLISACSNDEEEPAIEEVPDHQIGLFLNEDGTSVIQVPQAMLQSSDPRAAMAASYVNLSTSFSLYSLFFQIPNGAKKSSQAITAPNGRTAAGVTVYEWSGPDGSSIAYQWSEKGGQDYFEIFIKEAGLPYLKFMDVLQKKDGSSGLMKLFSEDGPELFWTWEKLANESYLLVFSTEDTRFEVLSNKDKSGTLKFFSDGALQSETTWDSLGNGSWKDYNEDGSLREQGNWTV